jgi:hypothetical protein
MNKVSDMQYTKVKKEGFLEIHGKDITIMVDGHDFDCVLYRPDPKRHFAKWNVIEQETGLLAGYGDTKKAAIAHAIERLMDNVTEFGWEEFLSLYFIGNEASPRYGGGIITA